MTRSLVVDCKVAGEAPDFNVVVEAVKDKIAIFILAVGPGTNVILGSRFVWYPKVRGLALLPEKDSKAERRRRDGSRRDHLRSES